MVILTEDMADTATSMVIPTEDMAAMARDPLTLARTTLSRTEELPRLTPRPMPKQDLDLEATDLEVWEDSGLEDSGVMVSGDMALEVWAWDTVMFCCLRFLHNKIFFSQEDLEDTEEVCMAVVFMVAMDSGRSIVNTD